MCSIPTGYFEEAAVISRHAETLCMRNLRIVHAKDAQSLAARDSAERTMTSSIPQLNLGGFQVDFDGDRVGSKLVKLSLIGGVGRVLE